MGHKVEMTPEKAAAYGDLMAGRIVIRTWKRDGSTNAMSFEQAVRNLTDNATGYSQRTLAAERRLDIVERLMAGGVVETKQARYRLLGA